MSRFGTLRARLLAGFFTVVGVFAVASWMTVLNRRSLQRAIDEVREGAEGIRASLNMANAAREVYVHVAHVVIERELEHTEHVDEAKRQMERWKAVVASKLGTDEERRTFREIEERAAEVDRVFRERIVPAARAGDEARVQAAHHDIERLVTKLLAANDALSDHFAAKIDETFTQANELAEAATRRDLIFVAVATALAVVLSLATARSVVRPVGRLLDAAKRISLGELGYEARVDDRGELGALADGLNAMSRELRERYDALVQAEKLASIGRVAAGIAHELNNPLGVILGYVLTMKKDRPKGSQDEEDLRTVEGEVRQCQRIVMGLLELARPIAVEAETVDLAALVRDELAPLEDACRAANVRVEEALPRSLLVSGDAGRLRQVLGNIFRNAIEAMPEGGTLRVRQAPIANGGSGRAAVEISDTGVGIAPEHLGRVFEPFFTTKKDGTGLGLSISYGIVRALKGELRVESRPGAGAGFTLVLHEPEHAA